MDSPLAGRAVQSPTPPGPLLFMSPPALDEDGWLPAPLSLQQRSVQQISEDVQQQGEGALVSPTSVDSSASGGDETGGISGWPQYAFHINSGSPASFLPPQQQQQQARQEFALGTKEAAQFAPTVQLQQRDVIDLSAARQDRDPFEGVELWLEDERRGSGDGGGDRDGGGVSSMSVMIYPATGSGGSGSTFPVVDGGAVAGEALGQVRCFLGLIMLHNSSKYLFLCGHPCFCSLFQNPTPKSCNKRNIRSKRCTSRGLSGMI